MFSNVQIKNFKCIKEFRFDLGTLNILTGLNGMGKSSFVEAVLLLYQNVGKIFGSACLFLNGDLVKLETAKDVLYQYAQNEEITLEIGPNKNDLIRFDLVALSRQDVLYFKEITDMAIGSITTQIPPDAFLKTNHLMKMDEYAPVINETFSKLTRLEALRQQPQTLHQKSSSGISWGRIGLHGEFTAHYLVERGSDAINSHNMCHPESNSLSLMEQVNTWLGEISPGIRVNVEEIAGVDRIKLDVQYQQKKLGFTSKYKPNHVGFGISYVLPVITALLAADPGEVVIIDSPESHLHPQGQATIGLLASLAAANGIQVILETHSDHVINGVRVAVKEERIKSSDVALFYFDREITETEQFANITKIEIRPDGDLSDYPENLLNEWANQLMKLV
ncbi:DUF3696 domain-containing protein [Deltaproteobacteria bacterium OttesenSCG-928-M10]|nr:DUF3696 domain-containing protein [Deltaproteobacteria bacterium OttesenSCG-928-M10]